MNNEFEECTCPTDSNSYKLVVNEGYEVVSVEFVDQELRIVVKSVQ